MTASENGCKVLSGIISSYDSYADNQSQVINEGSKRQNERAEVRLDTDETKKELGSISKRNETK